MLQENLDSNSAVSELVEEYEVEKILSRMVSPQGALYLIKWKGYPKEKDFTWEPLQHLIAVKELVDQFNKKEDQKQRQRRKQTQNSQLDSKNFQKFQTQIIHEKQQQLPDQSNKAINQNKNQATRGKILKDIARQKKKKIEKPSNKVENKHKLIHKRLQVEKQIYNKCYGISNFKRTQFSPQIIEKVSHHQEKLQLGHINTHFMKQKELFLDVSFVDQNKITRKCSLIKFEEIDKKYSKIVQKYLEDHLEFMLKMQLQMNLHSLSLR